jgi:protein gp37
MSAKPKMNKTNDNIEWAAWSWNPVTGCLHNCPYCYARDIANRFYPQGFEPTFHPGRLTAPDNTKAPTAPRWPGDVGYRNVFTCSMADLFGKWVPAGWIEAVLEAIARNPQWTFLLLSKFPIRMAEFDYPPNVWLGTSVDRQHAVHRAETAFTKIKESGFSGVCWLSCEPMLERLTFGSLDMFDWVVMGGASKSTQTPEYQPPSDDIAHLFAQARAAGCCVYQKTNLIAGLPDERRIREYPAGASSPV